MIEGLVSGMQVRLISGGPAMTVTAVNDKAKEGTVEVSCVWFDKTHFRKETFDLVVLEPFVFRPWF